MIEERNVVSSIPEALPTPRHLRRVETESRPLIDKGAAMELAVAIVVAWIVLALVGALAGHVTQGNVPFNATYSRPQ